MRWNGQGDFISDDYRVIYSGADTGRNGVGIILSTKWAKCVNSYIAYDDRIIMIKLKGIPNDILILQVYIPTTQAREEEVEDIYEKIKELIKLTNGKENIIIIGTQLWVKVQTVKKLTGMDSRRGMKEVNVLSSSADITI